MNNKIINLLKTTAGALGFALFGGVAYFLLAMKFVMSTTEHGGLLLLFIAPAVICGAALILIKLIKQNNENGSENANITIFYLHILLFALSVVFAVSAFV
jgi:hypothetical protein